MFKDLNKIAFVIGLVVVGEIFAVFFFWRQRQLNLRQDIGEIVQLRLTDLNKENISEKNSFRNLPELKDDIQEYEFTLLFGGDVMLGRTVNTQQLKNKNMNWAWEKVGARLRAPTITMFNLETPVIEDCAPTDEGMVFCAPKAALEGLKGAGVDIVNLANNHILNQGKAGLEQTRENLEKVEIDWVGTQVDKMVIKKISGVKVGFIGFDDVSQALDVSKTMDAVKKAKAEVDLLIVNWHWGSEYRARPTKRQQLLARQAIENGADAIIGHHPHWVQTNEMYQDKPIYYSLGNFIFDQMWSEETKKGLVVELLYKVTFNNKGVNIELSQKAELPIYITNYGQPEWVN